MYSFGIIQSSAWLNATKPGKINLRIESTRLTKVYEKNRLEENLREIYCDLTSGEISGIRRSSGLQP